MTDVSTAVLQAAVFGPAVAGLGWVAFARSLWGRRVVGGALAVASHAAAWWVLWLSYRGEAPAWQGLRPGLLMASVVVASEIGILLALTRVEARAPSEIPAVVVGMAAAASANVVVAWSGSLVVQSLLIPLPTVAVGLAGLSAAGGPDVRGHLGLAAADAAALAGLSAIHAATGTTVAGPASGLGPALLLAAAAAKVGALPGMGTWRLVAAEGPASPLAPAVRGQGVALAALAGLVMTGGSQHEALAGIAASVVLIAGITAAVATGPLGTAAALSGAAGGVPFVALGLGGAVGARAFLLLFPAMLIGTAAMRALAEVDPALEGSARGRAWRPLGVVAAGVAVASVAGVPAGGAFPGTWLTVSLAAVRGEASPLVLLLAGGVAVGLALGLFAAVPLVRWARPRPVAAVAGSAAAAVLLYMGIQPVRLGIGWWLRIERELRLPAILPAAGAPSLPPVGGLDLVFAVAPALAIVVAVVLAARGSRPPSEGFVPLRAARRRRRRRPAGPVARVGARAAWVVDRASALALGFGAALVLEGAAVTMAIRLLFLGARAGFL